MQMARLLHFLIVLVLIAAPCLACTQAMGAAPTHPCCPQSDHCKRVPAAQSTCVSGATELPSDTAVVPVLNASVEEPAETNELSAGLRLLTSRTILQEPPDICLLKSTLNI